MHQLHQVQLAPQVTPEVSSKRLQEQHFIPATHAQDLPALPPTKHLPARPMAHHTPHAYATVDTGVTPPPTLPLDAQQGHPTTVKVSAWPPRVHPAQKDTSTH